MSEKSYAVVWWDFEGIIYYELLRNTTMKALLRTTSKFDCITSKSSRKKKSSTAPQNHIHQKLRKAGRIRVGGSTSPTLFTSSGTF